MLLQSEVNFIIMWEDFCFTKRGKWYYNVGQVLQNGTIFITKWERTLFQSGAIIIKKRRIVENDSDNSVIELQSLNAKLL